MRALNAAMLAANFFDNGFTVPLPQSSTPWYVVTSRAWAIRSGHGAPEHVGGR